MWVKVSVREGLSWAFNCTRIFINALTCPFEKICTYFESLFSRTVNFSSSNVQFTDNLFARLRVHFNFIKLYIHILKLRMMYDNVKYFSYACKVFKSSNRIYYQSDNVGQFRIVCIMQEARAIFLNWSM